MEEGGMSILSKVRLAGAVLSVLCAAAFCFAPSSARAQNFASVTGTVTDSAGATVPGASIVLIDTRTNNSYFAKTAGDGTYRVTDLPPGPGYALTVKKDGFETFVVNNLYLPVAVSTTQDVSLALGTLSQKVEVTAEGSVTLNTTDATIGNNLDMHAIQNLPNEFRDDPSNLLRLEPGVISAQTPSGGPTSGPGAIDPNLSRDGSVAGSRADQGNIVVDGIDATSISSGFSFTTQAAIPIEAVQEFSTLVANPTPAYGGRGGAQTLITTKSGSNNWHGTAYEYNRTAATEADNFFNNQDGIPRTALERNQFGGNVGGPVWRDKLFFFFEYDGRRDNSGQSVLDIVPMPHVKLGELAYVNNGAGCVPTDRLTSADVSTSCVTILSAAQVAALDPCSTANCSATPGFQAPGVDPTLSSIFTSRYPNPNDFTAGDGINTAGFRFNSPNDLKENDYLARTDYNINSKNKLFIRFNFKNETSVLQPNEFPTDPLTSPNIDKDRAWVIGETWTATPNIINQFTYGETRENSFQPILFNPGGGFFELSFDDGYTNPYLRATSFTTVTPEPTFRDDVTWVHGKHTFVFGAEYNPITIADGITNDFAFVQNGFGGFLTSLPASATPANILQPSGPTGPDPFGAALSNWDSSFVGNLGSIFDLQASINYTHAGSPLPSGSNVVHDYRFSDYAGYLQDSWRMRSDFTITAGVRYQYQSVPYEVHGVEATFLNTSFRSLVDTRVANGLAGIATPDSTPELTYSLAGPVNHAPGFYKPEYHDFSPRLGLAWNPSFHDGILGRIIGDHKTVFRSGASLIYDETVVNNIVALENQADYTFGGSFAENFGVKGDATASLETMPRLNSLSASPVPVVPPPFVTPITPIAVFNYDSDNHFRTPYSITASFGFQRELPGGLQLEADYFGNFGRKLFVLSDAAQLINFVDPASGQSLGTAMTYLEKQAQAGATSVTNQPFFENQVGAALASAGTTCAAFYGSSCTAGVYAGNQLGLQQGSTAGVADSIPLPVNVGFNPQFLVNALGTNQGSSSYNALFVTLRKRLSHNLQFDFDYTYSHGIDNNSTVPHANGNFEPGVTTILCSAVDTHLCRGNSEYDATHAVSAYFVYDLPFGRGQAFGRNVGWFVDEVIGGWGISGIETWRTGLALTVVNGVASTTSLAADSGDEFIGPRSALAESIHIDTSNNNQVQFYKNPSAAIAAFTPDLGFQTGTRDNLRGPHFSDFDVSVYKNFPLWTERYKLQFRADAYNAFNHTNFGLPNTQVTSSQFGQLSSEAGVEPDRVMQFALRFDF
jgi:Carboxypeptidase regulatory-like domain